MPDSLRAVDEVCRYACLDCRIVFDSIEQAASHRKIRYGNRTHFIIREADSLLPFYKTDATEPKPQEVKADA